LAPVTVSTTGTVTGLLLASPELMVMLLLKVPEVVVDNFVGSTETTMVPPPLVDPEAGLTTSQLLAAATEKLMGEGAETVRGWLAGAMPF
jgi:hypothetical protein